MPGTPSPAALPKQPRNTGLSGDDRCGGAAGHEERRQIIHDKDDVGKAASQDHVQSPRQLPGQGPQQEQHARRQGRHPWGKRRLPRHQQDEQDKQAQPFPQVEEERQLLKIGQCDLQVFSLLIPAEQAQIGAMAVVGAARDDPQAAQEKGGKSKRTAGFLRDQDDVIMIIG